MDVGLGNVLLTTIPLLLLLDSSTIWLWLALLELVVFEMALLVVVELFGVKVIMSWSSSPSSNRRAAVDAFRGGGAGGVVALDCCMAAAAAACWRKWL